MGAHYVEAKQKSSAELAEGYWLSTGLVWWRAVQQMQVELRKMLRDTRRNSRITTEYMMEHAGSGQIPPPLKMHLPIVAPGPVAGAIAGMQAFAIEIILKGALARDGKEGVEGHKLSKLWNELSDSVKEACETDFSSRLAAAEWAGYQPGAEEPEPRTIEGVLPRHNDDFMVFRYAQTRSKGKWEMRERIVLRDRLQMLLILHTLEHVLVWRRQPLTSKDEEQMQATGKSVKEWFSEG